MKKRLKYRLFALQIEPTPEAKEVINVYHSWADRVIPTATYTLKKIVDKTPFSYENISRLRETMVLGQEKQRLANRHISRLEYGRNIDYLDEIMVDMFEQIHQPEFTIDPQYKSEAKYEKIIQLKKRKNKTKGRYISHKEIAKVINQ